MNLPDFGIDWRKRWVYLAADDYDYLHRVKKIETWDDGYIPIGGPGETVCGLEGRLAMPGVMARMGLPRCEECCRRLDISPGDGAPFNDKSLSEEKRRA